MARINLLPWREQKRAREKKLTILIFLTGLLSSFFIVFLMNCYASNLLHNQATRNQLLKKKIEIFDRKIKEINKLEAEENRFISRVTGIQNPQSVKPSNPPGTFK